MHAIGDRANNIILDAFEKALEGVNVSALRPRLEHAQMMTSADMIRLGKLGGKCYRGAVQYFPNLDLCSYCKRTANSCVRFSDLHVLSLSSYPLSVCRISDMWYAEDRLVGLLPQK